MSPIVSDINVILRQHGISSAISLEDITITSKTITDMVLEGKLSNLLINHVWPSIPEETVYHYTSKVAAESIANSGAFRFYSLMKRASESEVESFCRVHALDGYLDASNRVPKYKTDILPNTFFASFTSTGISNSEERYFWNTFAHSDGARLKLKITAKNPDFRALVYGESAPKPIPVLTELTKEVLTKYKRHFILAGISRLCAFYLPSVYAREKERRALYRHWPGVGLQPKNDGLYDFIELPLGATTKAGYQLDLLEIQSDENLNVPDSKIVVKRNP